MTPLLAHSEARTLRAAQACPDADVVVVGAVACGSGGLRLRQRGTTFGQRLAAAILDVRSLGYDHVVAVGTDTPAIESGDLAAAFRALAGGASVVLGPAGDGGCFLIGLAGPPDPGFETLPWRSSRLLAAFVRLPGRIVLLDRSLDDLDGRPRIRRFRRAAAGLPRETARLLRELSLPQASAAATPAAIAPVLRVARLRSVTRRGPPSAASGAAWNVRAR
jgi:hypothetical protein